MPAKKRIYFDHAATSYPKPPGVVEAISSYMMLNGASAGRGAYQEAFQAKTLLEETRKSLASLFNASHSERFFFTLNATDALNSALKGLLKDGDHVIVSSIEHNSVSRPLQALQQRLQVEFTQIPVNLEGELDWKKLEQAFCPRTKLIAFLHGSNVSGTLTPIAQVGEFARKKGVPLLIDASQTAGSYPIDVEAMKIDLLALPGHKGLLGPLGTGALWVRPGIDLETLREGGTGSFSEEDAQPQHWPDLHESGSHNLVGLVGLQAALGFLKQETVEKIRRHKEKLVDQFLQGVRKFSKLRIIAPRKKENNAGVVSLQFEDFSPQEAALRLDEAYRIQVRPGLHCSPWAHRSFATYPVGTLRFSFGYSNTEEEIGQGIEALWALTQR